MLNDNKDSNMKPTETRVQTNPSRPNEAGQLQVLDHVKIYDPNTKETFLEKRA